MRSSHPKLNPDVRARGVGLIDVVVVMTIMLILGAVSIPQFLRVLYDTQLRASAAEVAELDADQPEFLYHGE